MPFQQFELSQLQLKPLRERQHDITRDVMISPEAPTTFEHPALELLADRIRKARERNGTVLWMLGAHVIRGGNGPVMIKLMEEGDVTHFALNGAGAIHDFELAMIGATTESVAKYISEGQFGLWKESGKINDAVREGAREGLGFGESVGRLMDRENFPYKESSLLWNGYKNKVPVTVHVGIGCDIIHEHPNLDGAMTGLASYTDFLIFAQSMANLEGGVFCNIGNAVIGPEMFLKTLAMARNVAHRERRKINRFTSAVFDLPPFENKDFQEPLSKDDPRHYFRPWKMILAQTVADGGEAFYIAGEHRHTVPALAKKIRAKSKEKSRKGVPKAATHGSSFSLFDRTRLQLEPIGERTPLFTQADMRSPDAAVILEHPVLDMMTDRVRRAKERKSTVMWMLGASAIHRGNGPILVQLMQEGYVTHYALNGAAAFQDFELAMVGGTLEDFSESVAKGRMGLWTETGDAFNRALADGMRDGFGFGEAVGRAIDRGDFPHKKNSVLWNAYKAGVPATVHPVLGCDVYQELPGFDGAAAGRLSHIDFLIYTQSVMNLEGGVFYDFGSRTIGPEVYLKALSMSRNVAHQRGQKIAHFTTAVIDVLPLEGLDIHEAPPKSDPRYYFRPWKTILARTVADGGESHYVMERNQPIIPALAWKIRHSS